MITLGSCEANENRVSWTALADTYGRAMIFDACRAVVLFPGRRMSDSELEPKSDPDGQADPIQATDP